MRSRTGAGAGAAAGDVRSVVAGAAAVRRPEALSIVAVAALAAVVVAVASVGVVVLGSRPAHAEVFGSGNPPVEALPDVEGADVRVEDSTTAFGFELCECTRVILSSKDGVPRRILVDRLVSALEEDGWVMAEFTMPVGASTYGVSPTVSAYSPDSVVTSFAWDDPIANLYPSGISSSPFGSSSSGAARTGEVELLLRWTSADHPSTFAIQHRRNPERAWMLTGAILGTLVLVVVAVAVVAPRRRLKASLAASRPSPVGVGPSAPWQPGPDVSPPVDDGWGPPEDHG